MPRRRSIAARAFDRAALACVLCLSSRLAAAAAPAWIDDPCAGLDCAADAAGVGQSELLPEMRLSSAAAYASAARELSSRFSDRTAVDDRLYLEGGGKAEASAVVAVVDSPLGRAMTKIYGDDSSDLISSAVELRRLDEGSPPVYAQEYVDVSSQTLYVRLVMSRSTATISIPAGGVAWKGARVRVSSEDIRAGRKNELALWVEDEDAGLTWVEYWPDGGADLMRGGAIQSSYVFDRLRGVWKDSARRDAVSAWPAPR